MRTENHPTPKKREDEPASSNGLVSEDLFAWRGRFEAQGKNELVLICAFALSGGRKKERDP